MADYDQPITTYSDTTPRKRVITDVISNIDPTDAPFIERIGGLDGASGKFRFVNGDNTNVEWLEDTMPGLTTTLAVATIASNATSATVADATPFQKGDIFLLDAQYFWISDVNKTSEVLTFSSIGGTAATHATGATLTITGQARLEGAESDPGPVTDKTTGSNYTQIWHKEVKASGSMAKVSQWGISDEFDYQAAKSLPDIMRRMEKHLLVNPVIAAGSASTPRIMGGLPAFLTANATSGASLTKAKFENAVKLAYEDGGTGPWLAPLSSTNFQKVCAFYDSSAYLRVTREENVVGMAPVERIVTPFGDVYALLDRWAVDGTIYLVDEKHVGLKTFREFTQETLAKTGDYERGQVVGEVTLCARQANSHASLTSVS